MLYYQLSIFFIVGSFAEEVLQPDGPKGGHPLEVPEGPVEGYGSILEMPKTPKNASSFISNLIGGNGSASTLLSHPIGPKLTRNNVYQIIKKVYKTFDVSFDLYINSYTDNGDGKLFSVFHMTTGRNFGTPGSRIPAVWVYGWSQQLAVYSGVNCNVDHRDTYPVKLKTWYHVQIKQVENKAKQIVYTVLVNNQAIVSLVNTQPSEYKNVKAFVADPWHPALDGHIKNIQIITPVEGVKLTRNKVYQIIKKVYKTFVVSFDLYINSLIHNSPQAWDSVFHMTTGGNYGTPGSRIPAVFVNRPGKYLGVFSGVNGNVDYRQTYPVKLKTWYHVQIKQVEKEGKNGSMFVYTILVNNEVVTSLVNTKPSEYENVKVFVTDPWHPVLDGHIKNIQIITPFYSSQMIK